uniref:Globin n=2 Tax=Biomphalaria TaxID=6525 RepID=A0A2C9JUR8_BIOGL
MVTSLAKLGRKGVQKGRSADSLDEDEEFLYNNRDTPVFVLPEDQVDVSDKAPVPLTEEQGQLLKESWVIIKKHVTEVGVETFIGLFNTHPESIDSFLAFKDKSVQDLERSAVLKAHALRVMQTVDKCITRLDKPERMTSLLLQLGKRHVDYQANIKLIPIIGKQFIGAIEPKMGNAWSHDIKASWAGLFSIINYNMRLGLMEEKNKRIQASKDIESSRKKSEEKRRRDRK